MSSNPTKRSSRCKTPPAPPKFVAYCSSPTGRTFLDTLEPPPLVTADWYEFEKRALTADCLIIVVESLASWERLSWVRPLRARRPVTPWVLMTRLDESNLAALGTIEVDVVVPYGDVAVLAKSVRRADGRPLRLGVVSALAEFDGISARAKELLAVLFLASPPPRKCAEWAALVHYSESTLKHRIDEELRPTELTAGFLVRFNLLLAAYEKPQPVDTWLSYAASVDVGVGRLRLAVSRFARGGIPQKPSEVHPGALVQDLIATIFANHRI